MFAHVFCPNLLVQCERLFHPELKSRALIVYELIAHEDSNFIRLLACSSQARELGFDTSLGSEQLGQLIEEFSNHQEPQTLAQCQPNRELYADMSKRLFSSLEMLAPNVIPIAGDEAYLDLSNLKRLTSLTHESKEPPGETNIKVVKQLQDFAYELRHSIMQWLGLEIFIGIGATKTLAYLGCMAAKHEFDQGAYNTSFDKLGEHRGTAVLTGCEYSQSVLANFTTSNIRGISAKALSQLSALGIHTALELSQASSQLIGKRCSVLVEHLAVELAGLTSQLSSEKLESNQLRPKQLITRNTVSSVARTKPVKDLMSCEIQECLVSYTKAHLKAHIKGTRKSGANAAMLRIVVAMLVNAHKELITRQLICHKIEVVLERADLLAPDEIFTNRKSISLSEPSDTLGPIKKLCRQTLESMVCDDSHYRSIYLTLKCQDQTKAKQVGLFESADRLEQIAQLSNNDQQFRLVQRHCKLYDVSKRKINPQSHSRLSKSPSYTSRWNELLRVN